MQARDAVDGDAADFDVARVRGLYLTVGTGPACLDGPLSTLQPESVIRAIVATLRSSPTQPGGTSYRSQRTASCVHSARARVRRSRRRRRRLGRARRDAGARCSSQFSELLAARLAARRPDRAQPARLRRACVTPWLRAARASGVSVRWAEVDLETGELPTWQYEHLIGPHTRLVTVPLGNPATGTVPDVRAIADLAHERRRAGRSSTPAPPRRTCRSTSAALGADLIAVAAPSFGGPDRRRARSPVPACCSRSTAAAHPPAPQRFEFGPLPVELLDGATAAIDHLAGLDEHARGTPARAAGRLGRRRRRAHRGALGALRRRACAELPHVTVFGGVDRPAAGAGVHRRAPPPGAGRRVPRPPRRLGVDRPVRADPADDRLRRGRARRRRLRRVHAAHHAGRGRPAARRRCACADARQLDAQQHLADVLAGLDQPVRLDDVVQGQRCGR